jgi:hypothetical protein
MRLSKVNLGFMKLKRGPKMDGTGGSQISKISVLGLKKERQKDGQMQTTRGLLGARYAYQMKDGKSQLAAMQTPAILGRHIVDFRAQAGRPKK